MLINGEKAKEVNKLNKAFKEHEIKLEPTSESPSRFNLFVCFEDLQESSYKSRSCFN